MMSFVPAGSRVLTLIFVSLVVFGVIARADTYPRQPGIDALHYVFRLTLTDQSDEIVGEASIDFRFVRDGVTAIELDLTSAGGGKGMTVSEVWAGSTAVKFEHANNRLRIFVSPAPKAGERRQFTVKYRGVPGNGLRMVQTRYKDRSFFSENWHIMARQWLPMIDHPYDKASSEFVITAPAKYQAVANGLLQEERDLGDGNRLTHWKQSVPIASWLNAIGVAQFSARRFGTFRGIELQNWVYYQDREKGIATFDVPTRQAIEFFSDKIGPYPYEKLANVQAAGISGGTEHASAIFYGERSVTDRPATNLVAHEIAHQWWGNSVTEKDWDDCWLSEGFATYFTNLFVEHYSGRDAFVAGLRRGMASVFRYESQNPGRPVIHDNIAEPARPNTQLVYQKGGWFLHILRGHIGTEKFWQGIRAYYKQYRDSNASTEDLRRVMEETSGQDLAWLFRQWLNRSGSPAVSGLWSYNGTSKKIEIELAQTGSGEAFRLPLEIGVRSDAATPLRIEKVEFNSKQQRFEIAAEKEPLTVELDPNVWILMDAKFAKR